MPKRKRQRTEGEVLVDSANELDVGDFEHNYVHDKWLHYRPPAGDAMTTRLDFNTAATVRPIEHRQCFNLIETTSRADYEASSRGWRPTQKQREMKESEMRYLLVRCPTIWTSKPTNDVEGFISFMLTHDSTPSVPVLYIYEIHLADPLRNLGLGKHLMDAAEDIARRVGVEKVMLTCFLSNEKAHAFYRRRGYEADICTPTDRKVRGRTVKADYVIMSKSVR